ncbi:12908_t:CDS:2 [Funneliformis geosporum]|uniref:12908_t:CDS:1 n=1 Tax=Funneliformis geosporum TaxID=1117311 RepID=A0A9W4SV13_9GLOM|nr:12908_t:CDS:2 [Funneliformis geosporum]
MDSMLTHTYETPFNCQENYFGNPKSYFKDNINFTCKELSLDFATAVEYLGLLYIVFSTVNVFIEKNLETIKGSVTSSLAPAKVWDDKQISLLLEYLSANITSYN